MVQIFYCICAVVIYCMVNTIQKPKKHFNKVVFTVVSFVVFLIFNDTFSTLC